MTTITFNVDPTSFDPATSVLHLKDNVVSANKRLRRRSREFSQSDLAVLININALVLSAGGHQTAPTWDALKQVYLMHGIQKNDTGLLGALGKMSSSASGSSREQRADQSVLSTERAGLSDLAGEVAAKALARDSDSN